MDILKNFAESNKDKDVHVYLASGTKLIGRIVEMDDHALILGSAKGQMGVNRLAVATIQPYAPISNGNGRHG